MWELYAVRTASTCWGMGVWCWGLGIGGMGLGLEVWCLVFEGCAAPAERSAARGTRA